MCVSWLRRKESVQNLTVGLDRKEEWRGEEQKINKGKEGKKKSDGEKKREEVIKIVVCSEASAMEVQWSQLDNISPGVVSGLQRAAHRPRPSPFVLTARKSSHVNNIKRPRRPDRPLTQTRQHKTRCHGWKRTRMKRFQLIQPLRRLNGRIWKTGGGATHHTGTAQIQLQVEVIFTGCSVGGSGHVSTIFIYFNGIFSARSHAEFVQSVKAEGTNEQYQPINLQDEASFSDELDRWRERHRDRILVNVHLNSTLLMFSWTSTTFSSTQARSYSWKQMIQTICGETNKVTVCRTKVNL